MLKLKRQIIFGYGVSAALFFLGGFKCYLTAGARPLFWQSIMWGGVSFFFATLLLPSVWTLLEKGVRWLMGKIGHCFFLLVLSFVYFFIICPVGWWLRRRQGCAPIWEWTGKPTDGEGWHNKIISTITPHAASKRQRFILLQPLWVIGFFIERRNYLLLPVIVILIMLGLTLFFAQTSVLAPFIYTLF